MLAGLSVVTLSACGVAATTPTAPTTNTNATPSRSSGSFRSGARTSGVRHRRRARRAGRKARRQPAPRQPAPLHGLAVSHASATAVLPQAPAGSCQPRGHGLFTLPDARCTPGAVSPAVTQSNLSSTICRSGYTETVRPSESITEPEKEASLSAYGDTQPLHFYEYDHLVPLELGGAPNDPRNLWPEPGASPNPKDELEYRLREMVCSGELHLVVAQREIASNWVVLYRRLIG